MSFFLTFPMNLWNAVWFFLTFPMNLWKAVWFFLTFPMNLWNSASRVLENFCEFFMDIIGQHYTTSFHVLPSSMDISYFRVYLRKNGFMLEPPPYPEVKHITKGELILCNVFHDQTIKLTWHENFPIAPEFTYYVSLDSYIPIDKDRYPEPMDRRINVRARNSNGPIICYKNISRDNDEEPWTLDATFNPTDSGSVIDITLVPPEIAKMGCSFKTLAETTQLFKYKKPKDARDEERCAVCVGELKHNEEVRKLPCNHLFHATCVGMWLVTSTQCPYCRGLITERR